MQLLDNVGNVNNVTLEAIKTLLSCVTLGFGWFVGQRIINHWDVKKKRQELDIETAMQFHKLYGEFKEVSRLWRVFSFTGQRATKLIFPGTTPLDLLKRAAAAEGGVETIIVKLATERVLNVEDIKTLGLFRQAYQKLREAIRDGAPLEWTHNTPEYTLYNNLASKAACIISSNKTRKHPKTDEAPKILEKITAFQSKQWQEELELIPLKAEDENKDVVRRLPAQYFRAGVGAVIIDNKGDVLALERANIRGAWQLPQGGIEIDEEPIRAAIREIAEETGIIEPDLELLDVYPDLLVYELPANDRREKTGRGQVQYWYLFRFHGSDDVIDVKSGREFYAWKWMSFQRLLHVVVDFRKPAYQKLADYFAPYIHVDT